MFQNSFKKRIFYIGYPDMGLVCLTKLLLGGANIVGVLAPPESAETYKLFMQYANGFKLNVIKFTSLKDENFLNQVKELNADIGIVCSFNKLIPKELLSIPKDGFFNCHPSLLPDYRGPNSYSHVIINNEPKTGVTIHKMDEHFDTGNIIIQHPVNLSGNETMGTLFNYLNLICANTVFEFIQYYENGGDLTGTPQGESNKIAYDISFDAHNNFIDWTKSAEYIERFVRALNPFVRAVTLYKNEVLQVNFSKVIDMEFDKPAGTVLSTDNGLIVATGDGALKITTVQYGSYISCEAEEFIKRFNVKVGDVLKNG